MNLRVNLFFLRCPQHIVRIPDSDDLTVKQAREIAETINDYTRAFEFDVKRFVDVKKSS